VVGVDVGDDVGNAVIVGVGAITVGDVTIVGVSTTWVDVTDGTERDCNVGKTTVVTF
jgi:hypothetical protein